MKNVLISATALLLFINGIGRHDVNHQEYLDLAQEPQFDCVGRVIIDGEFSGSCVLIDQLHVLSVAHVFVDSEFKLDTIEIGDGQTAVVNQPIRSWVIEPSQVQVEFKGDTFKVANFAIAPKFLEDVENQFDIALIRLDEPCSEVVPATLNTESDELNEIVTGVGYGVSGIASSPQDVEPRGEKIAGQNVIDSIGGTLYNGKPTILYADFDHPSHPELNLMGSATPLMLEYTSGGGDSGGGLFRFSEDGDKWELVGLTEGTGINIQVFIEHGYYGQSASWIRTSVMRPMMQEMYDQLDSNPTSK